MIEEIWVDDVEIIEEVWAKIWYNFWTRNKLKREFKSIFNWGDRTETTISLISHIVLIPHTYEPSGTYTANATIWII